MRKENKKYIRFLSFLLAIFILINSLNPSLAESDTIYIDSSEDLVKFSQDAILDTFFIGKTVVLRSNIDISNADFFPIPTFAGVFDGGGNTISGMNIDGNGSIQGLFRYLQEGGIVKNLNISGSIKPSGSQNIVGSLVGNNKGSIENCHFNGQVSGKNNVGGLVGINEATGSISNSSSSGNVNGEHFTGGIVGQNLGTILKSFNYSEVNTSGIEKVSSIEDINWAQVNSMENISAHTDTGGIAGISTGYIQDCANHGQIGYKYMGYNVGGIVGRQSGYLSNCKNYNTVLGRKDIGGVVGQVEPHLTLSFSEDILQKLDRELNILQNLMNKSYRNMNSSTDSISSEFEGIIKSLDKTRDSLEILSGGTLDHIDLVTDTINIGIQRIEYTLEEILPILDGAEEVSKRLKDGLDHIESGFDNLEITSSKMSDSLGESKDSIEDLRKAISSGEDAIYSIEYALNRLLYNPEDKNSVDDIAGEIEIALGSLEKSFIDGSQATRNIWQALKDIENIDESILLENIESIADDLKSISPIISRLSQEVPNIITSGLLERSRNTRKDLNYIFDDLYGFSKNLDRSIQGASKTISKLKTTSQQSELAFNDFSKGFSKFADSSESMTEMTVTIRDLVDSLVAMPDIELPNISSDYRQSGEELFDNIGDVSSKISKINEEIKDSTTSLINNMEAISDQIFTIFNLLIKSIEDRDESEYLKDISDENMDDMGLGTVYKNQNYGLVNGDVNVGGISGSIAIEYDLDPEDDIFKDGAPSLKFQYLTTAILRDCINHGKISSKKDYVGGIAGRMDLGLIRGCENYGDIESKEGSYVGGIAGVSYTSIENSFVLAALSGKDYIGGIAGSGKNISNSYTLVKFTNGVEWLGSIAGQAEGKILNNNYVNNSIGGIDGIDYSGKASRMKYKELIKLDSLPRPFTEFNITFIADGRVIDKIAFKHGESFNLELLPHIPVKDGYDSSWEYFESESMKFNTTVEAIYNPKKTVLSSQLLNKEGHSLLLAEGKFNKDTEIKLSELNLDNIHIPVKADQVMQAWNIDLLGLAEEDKENHSLRLFLEEDNRKASIWRLKGHNWEKIDSSINGSYLVFNMKGNSGSFIIVKNNSKWINISILFLLLLGGFIFVRRYKKKNR